VVSALFVGVAVALTVPWTYWILQAAYDRDFGQNVQTLARRAEVQLQAAERDDAIPRLLDALTIELLSDRTVRSIVLYDNIEQRAYRIARGQTRAQEIARTPAEIDALFAADSDAFSRKLEWRLERDPAKVRQYLRRRLRREPADAEVQQWMAKGGSELVRGYIYLDFSQAALRQQFWALNGSLLKRSIAFTGAAIVILSGVGIFAYRSWVKVGRVTATAALAQQGMLAERGLTAAVLAHEIRNPLAALRFQLHSLRRNAADAARVTDTCGTIDSELLRIQQLVQDYLAHERAQTMRTGPVALSEAAHALRSVMGELLRASETELSIVEPPDPVRVACDPHALRQVLMNLVLNAQQAMGRGGRITIALGRADGFGTIDVADTGPGIPEEMRDRVFKPFQTTKEGGSGIGLALVKRFVDNFGGNVSVDTEIGKGTTFHLRLPLAADGDAPAPQPGPVVAAG